MLTPQEWNDHPEMLETIATAIEYSEMYDEHLEETVEMDAEAFLEKSEYGENGYLRIHTPNGVFALKLFKVE